MTRYRLDFGKRLDGGRWTSRAAFTNLSAAIAQAVANIGHCGCSFVYVYDGDEVLVGYVGPDGRFNSAPVCTECGERTSQPSGVCLDCQHGAPDCDAEVGEPDDGFARHDWYAEYDWIRSVDPSVLR